MEYELAFHGRTWDCDLESPCTIANTGTTLLENTWCEMVQFRSGYFLSACDPLPRLLPKRALTCSSRSSSYAIALTFHIVLWFQVICSSIMQCILRCNWPSHHFFCEAEIHGPKFPLFLIWLVKILLLQSWKKLPNRLWFASKLTVYFCPPQIEHLPNLAMLTQVLII